MSLKTKARPAPPPKGEEAKARVSIPLRLQNGLATGVERGTPLLDSESGHHSSQGHSNQAHGIFPP